MRLIEAVRVGAGASGGVVGALTPHVPEAWNDKKAFQLQALLMAEVWWQQVAEASGRSTGYARLGRLQALDDMAAVALARTRAAGAADLWQGRATWQVVSGTGADWEPATATGFVVHDTLSARIFPRLALPALVDALRALGAEVIEGEAQDQGSVLWADGVAGLARLAEQTGRAVGGAVKGQAALLRASAPERAQIYAEGLHIVPHEGGVVAIGSTSEHDWTDPHSTDAQLDALIARARAALPILQDAPVIERWAGLRPRAASRAPVAGAWPDRPGHFILNGGFKIGFGIAPLLAERMADLILTGTAQIPEAFSPQTALTKAKPLSPSL